jgi:acetolactate synthase-1/3 small subunit
MKKPESESAAHALPDAASVLRLLVRNHPGVMSHVCGLFARRGFNLEAIVCLPCAGGARSTMLLAVKDGARLDQLARQLAKLEDVLEVSAAAESRAVFEVVSTQLG